MIETLESSSLAADLLTPAVVEGLSAVRRHELTTYGDRPSPRPARRCAWPGGADPFIPEGEHR